MLKNQLLIGVAVIAASGQVSAQTLNESNVPVNDVLQINSSQLRAESSKSTAFDICIRTAIGNRTECDKSSPTNNNVYPQQSILGSSAQYLYTNYNQLKTDPLNFFKQEGLRVVSAEVTNQINNQLRKIPFFAQTTVGADFSQGSAASYYLDSFMKLAELGKDADGDVKGLVFAQARYSAAYGFQGSTINTGIGSRYRLSDKSMVGVNGFWDYRLMTSYTSHSRFGVGAELYYSDFELRNNWYIAGTGAKLISGDAFSTTYERVVPGWDVELGYRLPSYPQLAFYLKGFNWDYVSRPDNSGIGASINWQATPHINVETMLSNEVPVYLTYAPSNDNSNVYVGVKFKYTFEPVKLARENTKAKLLQLLQQPVRRRYDVLLERYTVSNATGFSAIVVAQ
jgi:hypothetical protein